MQDEILRKLFDSPIDVWAITCILFYVAQKSVPLLKKLTEIMQSNLECLRRIETQVDKNNDLLRDLATKDDLKDMHFYTQNQKIQTRLDKNGQIERL